MSKIKIRKNLSDEEMLANYREEITFENYVEDRMPETKLKSKGEQKEAADSFFTPQLQEQVNKALLELKIKLYKQGIVDYDLKVTCEENQVIIAPIPPKGSKKNSR